MEHNKRKEGKGRKLIKERIEGVVGRRKEVRRKRKKKKGKGREAYQAGQISLEGQNIL